MILSGTPGVTYELAIRRYGTPGARPKAYIQAGLHADEVPGMLTAHRLCDQLRAVEAEGGIVGEVVVLPAANPIGLSQRLLGMAVGRDLADGANFNRGYPALRPDVAGLGHSPIVNTALVRAALQAAHAERQPVTPAQHLKHALLGLALDADIVLDLHCDGEALMHLYTLTPAEDAGRVLAGFLGAEALLLAEESGDDPFDEACSRPWLALHRQYGDAVPLACFAATVELRGQADVSDALAEQDTAALLAFLRHRGVLADPAPTPPRSCDPTPLTGTEPLVAPIAGIVVYRREVGERIEVGDLVADIVDPVTGRVAEVRAQSSGLLFARGIARFATAGCRLGKIAGTTLAREGRLLSP